MQVNDAAIAWLLPEPDWKLHDLTWCYPLTHLSLSVTVFLRFVGRFSMVIPGSVTPVVSPSPLKICENKIPEIKRKS